MFSNHYSHLCLSANMLFYPSLFPSPQTDKVKDSCLSTSNSIQLSCLSASFESLYQTLPFFVYLNIFSQNIIVSFLFICIQVFVITVTASFVHGYIWKFIGLCIKCSFTSICCIFKRRQSYIDVTKLSPPILCFAFHDRTQLHYLTFNTQPRVSCSLHVTLRIPPLLPSPVTLAYQCRAAVCEEISNI